jgi:tRNA(Arg) A34 adenosine deaminase TadA
VDIPEMPVSYFAGRQAEEPSMISRTSVPDFSDRPIAEHERHLRQAIELSRRARAKGNHPFGALLVGPDGAVLMEAENSVVTGGERTAHAELNLLRTASARHDASFLGRCTLYSSTEPCVMCAAALYWVGIGQLVYGLSKRELDRIVWGDPDTSSLKLTCRDVLQSGLRATDVIGPLLESEARRAHEDFWPRR